MKTLSLILALSLVCLGANAQLPISVRSTNGTAIGLTAGGNLTSASSTYQFRDADGAGFFSDGSFSWDASGNVSATSFTGSGAALTGVIKQTGGIGTNTTLSNLFTFNVLAVPTNTYSQGAFTYNYTNTTAGGYLLGTQAGGFAGMWPGYSVNFATGQQQTIVGFIGGNANGSGGNSTLAIITPRAGSSFSALTPLFISPNSYTYTDDNGNVQGYVDGGGQFCAPGDELQGMLIRATQHSFTNSMGIGLIFGDPDGNTALSFNDPFNVSGGGIFTISKGALFNSLNVRSNGNITAYNGSIISESGKMIGAGGIASSNSSTGIAITTTGITNSLGVNAKVLFSGTAVVVTFFNSAGTPYLTNTVTSTFGFLDILQPGGSMTCAAGGGGRLVPF